MFILISLHKIHIKRTYWTSKWGLQFSMFLSESIRRKHVKQRLLRSRSQTPDPRLSGKNIYLFSTELVILKNLWSSFGDVK